MRITTPQTAALHSTPQTLRPKATVNSRLLTVETVCLRTLYSWTQSTLSMYTLRLLWRNSSRACLWEHLLLRHFPQGSQTTRAHRKHHYNTPWEHYHFSIPAFQSPKQVTTAWERRNLSHTISINKFSHKNSCKDIPLITYLQHSLAYFLPVAPHHCPKQRSTPPLAGSF